MTDLRNKSRLDECGWTSFRAELFLNEPGRKGRDSSKFFLDLLRDFCKGAKVLELCSGSGKLLISLAKEGYEVVGVELSPEMLEVCKRDIAGQPREVRQRIRLVHDDMCSFNLNETFDLVILEDECFAYLLSTEDQIACLTRTRDHLADSGYVFLGFKTPYQELSDSESFEYDSLHQVKTTPLHWDVVDEQGTVRTISEGFERMKLTYPCELDLILKHIGLRTRHKWGDADRSPFNDPCNQEYHYLVEKDEPPG